MEFTLTLRDIRCGTRGECCECPLAIMFRRYFPGEAITVFPDCVQIGSKVVNLPYECTEFVRGFDAGRNPGPFSFNIDMGTARRTERVKPKFQGTVNACR